MIENTQGLALHWKILIALVLGVIAGYFTGNAGESGQSFISAFEFIGSIFLQLLKMLIIPLIASSIAIGVAGLGNSNSLGSLGFKTATFYLLTTTLAILTGLIIINLVQPGIQDGRPVQELLALSSVSPDLQERMSGQGLGSLVTIILRAIPENVVYAAAQSEMLAIIFFSAVFGYFMSQIEHELADTLYRFTKGVFETMILITHWVMKIAPYGVFGLVAAVVAKTGFGAAKPLLIFSGAVLVALLVHTFLTLPAMVRTFARRSPVKLIKAVAPAMLTAFSTSSSSATLPVTMDTLEHRAGVPNKYTSFVVPLGATVNMNGTALYECMAAMFIAQAYGLELSFVTQFVIVATALLTSIGVAGVPSASLVAISIILTAIGLPIEAVGILLVFDRFLDMARTTVNIFGDACCTVIVASMDGEELPELNTTS